MTPKSSLIMLMSVSSVLVSCTDKAATTDPTEDLGFLDADYLSITDTVSLEVSSDNFLEYQYGPESAVDAKTVKELIMQYGAPYEVVESGGSYFYRWGAGTASTDEDSLVTIEHNELLVEANEAGDVSSIQYLNRFQATAISGDALTMIDAA